MTPFHYDWNKERLPMGRELCATIAHILDVAGIPNVLWGKYMIFTYDMGPLQEAQAEDAKRVRKVPPPPHERYYITKYDDSISFIIPDDRINDARDALLLAGFPLCTTGCVCFDWKTHEMVPWHHFLGENGNTAENPALKLFRRSDVLFRFPDPDLAPPAPDDPWYMLTNDPRLPADDEERRGANPEGRFDAALWPIKIPTAVKLYEALILLRCRDNDYHSHSDGSWTGWSKYLARSLVKSGRITIPQVGELYRGVIEWDQADRLWFWDGQPSLLRQHLWESKACLLPFRTAAPLIFPCIAGTILWMNTARSTPSFWNIVAGLGTMFGRMANTPTRGMDRKQRTKGRVRRFKRPGMEL
ncbi:uncharacterized protein BO80DRAFT_476534 [Aspergillus ibericus CBS 121593]|uniref:Uncharacterized protein n=1 Tax=Aspergillus ibericus CBS 121593 TaxID=1448316 RepID=A0A395GXL9_9EURO|nr:hypothetical protein BO80DRAFT_476534 [Aspergillus ibericus CBS 121593]RAL00100.1 hypothetical protein BO80DRAFT_476534 [Aspergillus ibericus CBS 121593]